MRSVSRCDSCHLAVSTGVLPPSSGPSLQRRQPVCDAHSTLPVCVRSRHWLLPSYGALADQSAPGRMREVRDLRSTSHHRLAKHSSPQTCIRSPPPRPCAGIPYTPNIRAVSAPAADGYCCQWPTNQACHLAAQSRGSSCSSRETTRAHPLLLSLCQPRSSATIPTDPDPIRPRKANLASAALCLARPLLIVSSDDVHHPMAVLIHASALPVVRTIPVSVGLPVQALYAALVGPWRPMVVRYVSVLGPHDASKISGLIASGQLHWSNSPGW